MRQTFRLGLCLFSLGLMLYPVKERLIAAALADDHRRDGPYIAPFVPTPPDVVLRMLDLAEIVPGDVLYDLGSGDGRIVIEAAKRYRIKAVGFEINPALVEESRHAVKEAGLVDLVEIHEEDVLSVDLSPASVVTMYLYPAANLRLRRTIQTQLKPGSRVISHKFGMGDWAPVKTEEFKDAAGLARTLHLWRIEPAAAR